MTCGMVPLGTYSARARSRVNESEMLSDNRKSPSRLFTASFSRNQIDC